jgi:hypothetical protein
MKLWTGYLKEKKIWWGSVGALFSQLDTLRESLTNGKKKLFNRAIF